MAAADNLGEMCYCMPAKPFVLLLAMGWSLFGFWHMVHVGHSLIVETSDEWTGTYGSSGTMTSCQGSGCHEEMHETMFSCVSTRATSFRIRYLSMGMLGLLFGSIGFFGITSRNSTMVKAFAWFCTLMIVMLLTVLIWDNLYIMICGTLPMSMQKDIEPLISHETWSILRAQGHRDLAGFKATKIRQFLGYDFQLWYALYYAVVLSVLVYFTSGTFKIANALDGGPVGLGPHFGISTDPYRDLAQMQSRILEATHDHLHSVPHEQGFKHLEDGNHFPYLSSATSKPSINYGSVGAQMPQKH